MKRFWWGIFFGVVIGVLLLASESNFSYRVRELFFTLQGSIVAVLDAATQATGGMADGVDNLNRL